MLITVVRRVARALPVAQRGWQRPSFCPGPRQRDSRGCNTRCYASRAKRKEHCCSNCGYTAVQYFGSCPNCSEFGTCKEVSFAGAASAAKSNGASNDVGQAVSRQFSAQQGWLQGTARVSSLNKVRSGLSTSTNVLPLDGELGAEVGRVLGGGVRAGSLVLVGGGPGLGKSTLLIQLAALIGSAPPWQAQASSPLARTSERVLYISGEESEDQLAERAERLQIDDGGNVDLLCDNDMDVILEQIHAHKPKAVILDSIQTVSLGGVTGSNGSVSQVRECAKALVIVCKQTLGIPVFLVGHITKGGDLAGPKTLEHIVDATLYLEGEESSACRVLRVNKNRFGSTDEVGLFEMTARGLAPLVDPAAFLQQRQAAGRSAAACATAVLMEGNRPVMVEVQALCNEVFRDNPPRRMVNGGLDWKRFDQVLAVLIKHGRMKLYNQDARVNVLGGAPAMEPAADAAMAAAIISSFYDVQMPSDIAFVGEVDLGGDLRPVRATEKRVAAAVSLGFDRVLAPAGTRAKVSKALSTHVVDCTNVRALKRTLVGKASAAEAA